MQNEPITRQEILLNAVATGDVANLEPITREEMFLAKLGGADVTTPTPITRKEQFLQKAIESGTSGGGGTPGGGGGGTASVPWNDVTFIDYDGTVLHSYTLEEAQALTELPPLPEQKGLICQGWNWSLEDIKAQGKVIVGAMYITDDGKTRIYITLHEGRTSPMLGVCPKGTVTVDWGDGTEPDVLTGTSLTTVKWTPTHEYAKAGDYVISLSVDGSMGLGGSGSDNNGAASLRYSSSANNINKVYQNAITKVEIGDGVTYLGGYSFSYCYSLKSVTIPKSVTSIPTYAFNYCNALLSVVFPNKVKSISSYVFSRCNALASVSIPNGVTSIEGFAFQYCCSLTSVVIPKSVTSIVSKSFNHCHSLPAVVIPNGVTSIPPVFGDCHALASVVIPESVTSILTKAFYNCYSLASVFIPNGVTNIEAQTFYNCYGVRYFDFSACTSVPTLASSDAFTGIPADCQFLIPSALYDEWSTATNWATYASKMVAV